MRCSIRILLTFLIILLCVSWVHAETFYASYPEGCIGCLNGMPVSDPVIGSIQLPAGTIELTYDTRVTPRRVLNIVCGPDDFSFKGFDTRYPNDWFAIPGEIITRSGTPKRDGDPDGICGIDGEQHVVHTVTRLKLEKPITLEIRINPIVDTQGAWYQYAQQKEITISYKVLSEPGSTTTSPPASKTGEGCDGGFVQEGINHEWNDYGTPTPAHSVCECASLCKNDPQCVVVTYYRGKCYLKTALNPVVAPADANAASWVKGSGTTSSPASKTGEGCDGGFVQEGINHEWNDYGTPTPANSVCECASLCKNDPQCVVVTYYRGKCYLKTATNPVVAPADANAASWVKGSTTTSPSGSQTVGNCDGGTVQEGINHEWNDYGTPTPANSVCECASLCKNDPQCVVVTYYRGKCYLKTATNPVVAPADANAASWVKGYIE